MNIATFYVKILNNIIQTLPYFLPERSGEPSSEPPFGGASFSSFSPLILGCFGAPSDVFLREDGLVPLLGVAGVCLVELASRFPLAG